MSHHRICRIVSRRFLVLTMLVLGMTPFMTPARTADELAGLASAWAGQGPHRAFVVFDFDTTPHPESTFVFGVRFTSDTITGLEALEMLQAETDLDIRMPGGFVQEIAYPYLGRLYYGGNAWPTQWWSYWLSSDGGESYVSSEVGAGDRLLTDGAVDGWLSTNQAGWPEPLSIMPNRTLAAKFNPEADQDGDGRANGCESWFSEVLMEENSPWTHILLTDSDGDGLTDGAEGPTACDTETTESLSHPRRFDTDGDGWSDGVEVILLGSDPLDAADPGPLADADADGLPDAIDPDPTGPDGDGDRIEDRYELTHGADATDANSRPPLGDLNGDGDVDNIDAIALFHQTMGLADGPLNLQDGDINLDGFVNNLDAVILFQWTLGNAPLLPWAP